jgi:rSAM/selenodomain-associated transferase 1
MTPDVAAQAPALLVFAREPVAGTVKTRLAKALGAPRALEAYRELLEATLAYATEARAQGIVGVIELWCTPEPGAPFFRALAARIGASLHAQSDGDLGARMRSAIADALTRNACALLIGTDCPMLGAAGLAAAGQMLATHDAVLGPAEDGGFVLVGARIPVAFDGVRWSSAHTLQDTRAAWTRAEVRWSELPPCWDVDEPADLARWNALRRRPATAASRRS